MRLMQTADIKHLRCLSHEGKVLAVGVRDDGEIVYTIRRDGFEDDAGSDRQLESWEDWQRLTLPGTEGIDSDTSVLAHEAIENVRQLPDGSPERDWEGKAIYLTRSRYDSHRMHDVAPIAVVSGMGLVHVFRQAKEVDVFSDTPQPIALLVDRFVLDGMANRLVPKLDLRFRRSGQRYEPYSAGAGSKLVVDSLDFRDANDVPFTEPTTEIGFIDATGGCAVELMPAGVPDRFNWHFATRRWSIEGSELVLTMVRADEFGGFELIDRDGQSAIERRVIGLNGQSVHGAPTMTRFDRQAKRRTADGEEQWLRVSTGLMLAIRTAPTSLMGVSDSDADRSVASLQLPVRADGTLAPIEGEEHADRIRLRGVERRLPMAPDTLSRARAVTDVVESGRVTELRRGDNGEIEIVTDADGGGDLESASPVELALENMPSLDGLHVAWRVVLGTITRDLRVDRKATYLAVRIAEALPKGTRLQFGDGGVVTTSRDLRVGLRMLNLEKTDVAAPQGSTVYLADEFAIDTPESGYGNWTDTASGDGARVDGQILSLSTTGKQIRITAPGHGLDEGDRVDIVGTRSLDGSHHAVRRGNTFVIERAWPFAEAIDVARSSVSRRGLVLAGSDSRIEIEDGSLLSTEADFTLECWVRSRGDGALMGWFPRVPAGGTAEDIEPGSGLWFGIRHGFPALQLPEHPIMIGASENAAHGPMISDGEWHHVAAVITQQGSERHVRFHVDDIATVPLPIEDPLPSSRSGLRFLLGAGDDTGTQALGAHAAEMAEVRLWQTALSADRLGNHRLAPVHHTSRDLNAYWRLGAVLEGERASVVDATSARNDGIVIGTVWPTPVRFGRTMADGKTPVTRLENASLIGVSQGALYREELEYRFVDANGGSALVVDDQTDGKLTIALWGQASRNSGSPIDITPLDGSGDPETLDQGWRRVSVSYRVPDELGVVRSFGIAVDYKRWVALELRRHQVIVVESTTHESASTAVVDLADVGSAFGNSAALEREYEQLDEASSALNLRLNALEARHLAARETEARKSQITLLRQQLNLQVRQRDSQTAKRTELEGNAGNYWLYLKVRNNRLPGREGFVGVEEDSFDRNLIVDDNRPEMNSEGYSPFHWRIEMVPGQGFKFRLISRAKGPGSGAMNSFTTLSSWIRKVGVINSTRNNADNALSEEWYSKDMIFNDRTGSIWGEMGSGLFGSLQLGNSTNWSLGHFIVTYRTQVATNLALQKLLTSIGATLDPAQLRFETVLSQMHPAAESRRIALQNELSASNAEIKRLDDLIKFLDGLNPEKLVALERMISATNDELTRVDSRRASIEKRYLETVATGRALTPATPLNATDGGLPVIAARLAHVQSSSEISLFAAASGDVILSYIDARGRLRQTRFDAVADDRNSSSDQWIADGFHQALIGESGCVMPTPVSGAQWTFEAWLRFPLPHEYILLASSEPGQAIAAINGRFQFTQEDGADYLCDKSLQSVSPGWHHVAVIAAPIGSRTTVSFHIDGYRHGSPVGFPDASLTEASQADEAPLVLRDSFSFCSVGRGLAQIRHWDHALDDEELHTWARLRSSGREPGLVACYPLDGSADDICGGDPLKIDNVKFGPCTSPLGNPGQRVAFFDGDRRQEFRPDLTAPIMTLELWLRLDAVADQSEEQAILSFPKEDADLGWGYFALLLTPVSDDGYRRLIARIQIGPQARSATVPILNDGLWHHATVSVDWGSSITLALDAERSGPDAGFSDNLGGAIDPSTGVVGGAGDFPGFKGELAELRVRNGFWTPEQISDDRHRRKTFAIAERRGFDEPSLMGRPARIVNNLPIAADDIQLAEYPTYSLDSDGGKLAILRRVTAVASGRGVELLAQQRLEALELAWVGNAQFEPTLLGYIEGAPPVPSENLTLEGEGYQDATSVSLSMSNEVELSWNRSKEMTHGFAMDFFVGYENEFEGGINAPFFGKLFGWKLAAARAGLAGSFATSTTDFNETNIAFTSSITRSDTVGLRGHVEEDAAFPDIGTRFVPKNVGYALVVAGLADVFVSKLASSGRMVGYQIVPVSDVPPDVTTITFLINPAYTMNGSLDGLTGMEATSQRYFAHVPEARRQFGSLYPASYFRLSEAYAMRTAIREEDKRREAYFENFSVAISLSDSDIDERIDDPEFSPKPIVVERSDTSPGPLTGGSTDGTGAGVEPDKIDNLLTEGESTSKDAEQRRDEVVDDVKAQSEEKKKLVAARQKEIERLSDPEKREQASSSFKAWQRKMESLQIRAGKRNVANSYVWDADGGLRVESEEYAATVEHTVGSALDMEWGVGADIALNFQGFQLELSPMYQGALTQTLSKTRGESSALSLEIDLSGVEGNGVTDFKDRPLMPGIKVDRYRFMSFYLDGAERNFDDFFSYVVDPEWLASNDEEARALRQTRQGAKSKPWRVMHRVTQLERPALSGFGVDDRPLPAIAEPTAIERQLSEIEKRIALLSDDNARFAEQLRKRVDEVKELVAPTVDDDAVPADEKEGLPEDERIGVT